jgi:hypothetical protein
MRQREHEPHVEEVDPATRRNIAGGGGAAAKLLPEHHEALARRFPAWTFYAR